MPTGRVLCTAAARELNIIGPAENLSGEDADFILTKLNRLLNQWNAAKRFIPFSTFNQYTLTANLQPHTIGPSGTFSATVRPTKIVKAQLVETAPNPDSGYELRILDEAEWAAETVKALTSTLPCSLYYSPESPNGKIYLWPIPTAVNKLEIQVDGLLSSFATLDTSVDLAPAYEEAITLTLAEKLCKPFSQALTPELVMDAAKARAIIQNNNLKAPKLASDYGSGSGRFDITMGRNRYS